MSFYLFYFHFFFSFLKNLSLFFWTFTFVVVVVVRKVCFLCFLVYVVVRYFVLLCLFVFVLCFFCFLFPEPSRSKTQNTNRHTYTQTKGKVYQKKKKTLSLPNFLYLFSSSCFARLPLSSVRVSVWNVRWMRAHRCACAWVCVRTCQNLLEPSMLSFPTEKRGVERYTLSWKRFAFTCSLYLKRKRQQHQKQFKSTFLFFLSLLVLPVLSERNKKRIFLFLSVLVSCLINPLSWSSCYFTFFSFDSNLYMYISSLFKEKKRPFLLKSSNKRQRKRK